MTERERKWAPSTGGEIGANYLSTNFQRVLVSSLSLGREQSKTSNFPCLRSADVHGFAAGWRWFWAEVVQPPDLLPLGSAAVRSSQPEKKLSAGHSLFQSGHAL